MSALSEVDIRDWQRAEKIVEALPVASGEGYSNLPSWEDYDFLLSLIEKQLDGASQVAALLRPPVRSMDE